MTAHFQRSIVEDARDFQCVVRRPLVRKQNWRCGNHLQVDALPVKVFQSKRWIPAHLRNATELAISQHDHRFAVAEVLYAGPVG